MGGKKVEKFGFGHLGRPREPPKSPKGARGTPFEFESSFKLSILTLMNTVNSSIYGLEEFDFNNLHFFTKYTLIFFMIIGRIELLTMLLLIKKFLFKN